MPKPVVVVTGVGRALTTPDVVVVDLAVQVTAGTPGNALQRAGEHVAALTALLEREGITPSDRSTTGLSVNPSFDHEAGRPIGHEASYVLRVIVRDMATAGRLVQQAADEVGDVLRVHHFALGVRDAGPAVVEARAAAVRAVHDQAQQLADAAGLRLGRLVSLEEGQGHPSTTMVLESLSGRRGGGAAIEAGEHEVAVVVTGTFRLSSA